MRRSHRALVAGAATVALIGGYATLDTFDVVPGVLTTADAPREAVPLPGESAPPPDVRRPRAPQAPAALPGVGGTAPTPEGVRGALEPLLDAPGLGPATSMAVRDASTGQRLFALDADAPRTPASITKLLTAYAVSRTLDLDSTLATTVRQGPGDQVVLVAGGDTALARGRGNPDEVAGRAGLGDLAKQVAANLKKQGRTSVTVGWDLSYAPGPLQNENWQQDLVDLGFTTRVGMLGLADDRSDPGTAPPTDPARSATQAFVKALAAEGITAELGKQVTAPDGAQQLGVVRSAPLVDVIGLALRDSDNAMTESLGRQAAAKDGVPGDGASVTAWVLRVLREDGIDLRGVKLMDASGLADGTTIPARVVTDVLQRGASGQDKSFQEVLSRLPVSGWNGTLHNRFQATGSTDGAGGVRAKTGSLPGVSSLAGTVVTRDGRLLVFTIINNGEQPRGPLAARADLDRIVTALADCGCRA